MSSRNSESNLHDDCDAKHVCFAGAGNGASSTNQRRGRCRGGRCVSGRPPIFAVSWCWPKFQAQADDALKLPLSPQTYSCFKIPIHTFTMTSRPVSRALRQTARQLAASPAQKRTFVSALRAGASAAPKAAVISQFQQTRGIKTIDFAGTKETVYGNSMSKVSAIEEILTGTQSAPTGRRRSFL